MEHIAELGGIVTGFNITEQYIDCMCGKKLFKIDKNSREVICEKTIFEKEGFSRKLTADGGQIFINLLGIDRIKLERPDGHR